MNDATIVIDMDAKCKRCGKPGALPSGICLRCLTNDVAAGKYDHILKRQRAPRTKKSRRPVFGEKVK